MRYRGLACSPSSTFLLYCYLPYYVYRSMRVVYGEGRFKTLLKFFTLSTIYIVLLGFTMLLGLVIHDAVTVVSDATQ